MQEIPAQIDLWRNRLEEFKSRLSDLLSSELPSFPNTQLNTLFEEGLEELKTSNSLKEGMKKLLYKNIDSSNKSLSELIVDAKKVLWENLPDLCISTEEIQAIITQTAHRKQLGLIDKKKDLYENKDPEHLWIWELEDFPQPKEVIKERVLIGKVVRPLFKLITELQKENFKEQEASKHYSAYIQAEKALEKLKNDQVARKRKRIELEEEKQLKKAKLEEKRIKKQEEEKKKEQEKENKRKEKEAKRLEEKKTDIKPISWFVTKQSVSDAKDTPNKGIFKQLEKPLTPQSFQQLEFTPKEGDLESWVVKWKGELKILPSKKESFIYIHDSALKPYYSGPNKSFHHRNPFKVFEEVNYERDSEEEYEELFGEDLGQESDLSSDEFSSEEDEATFVVPDNYFSSDEIEDEDVQVFKYEAPKIQPLKIHNETSPDLLELKGFNIEGQTFPIVLIKKVTLKKSIDDHLEELKEIGQGKQSKKEILSEFLAVHSDLSKAAVLRKVDELFVKTKGDNNKLTYCLKEKEPLEAN